MGKEEVNTTFNTTNSDRPITSGIIAHFQPIYDVRSGMIVRCEALARLRTNDGKILPPADFLEQMSENDKPAFDMHMLDLACAFSRSAGVPVNVNVTHATLQQTGLSEKVGEIVQRHGIPADHITFEVVEEHFSPHSLPAIHANLVLLSENGHSVAVDDFPVKGSNRDRIAYFGSIITCVKMDKGFFNMEPEEQAKIIIELKNCRTLYGHDRLYMTIEGVEEHPENYHIQVARAVEADTMQGFGLARPGPPEAISALIAKVNGETPAPSKDFC